MSKSKLWSSVVRFLTGTDRRSEAHAGCRDRCNDLTAQLREAHTAEIAARGLAEKAKVDLYGLEVAVLGWAATVDGAMPEVLRLVDEVREQQGRAPLGLQRELIEQGHLWPVPFVEGANERARLQPTPEGERLIAKHNLRGLLAFALVALLWPAPARAESIAVSAAFQFTPQALDVISTRQCQAASNAAATCLEGNRHLGHRLELKMGALAVGLTFADHEIGKRSKAGKWALRVVTWGLAGLSVARNKKNEAAVRSAGR